MDLSQNTSESFGDLRAKLISGDIDRLRIVWVDLNGLTRCKTLFAGAALKALKDGIGLAGTVALKDTSDRTAVPVFSAEGQALLPELANAANLTVKPIATTWVELPWLRKTAWVQGRLSFEDGRACGLDTREVLRHQVQRLAEFGFSLQCGLEIEFHVYRMAESRSHLLPGNTLWPGQCPQLELLHPGYHLLSEQYADQNDEVFNLIQQTAIGLGLPLQSLEIEFGPSQFEAVFDVTDALTAADHMVLFRTAIKQVLARAGYHVSFMCKPPFPEAMASGWHLHHSLQHLDKNKEFQANAFASAQTTNEISKHAEHWLAGLLTHAPSAMLLATPTANGYLRYRPNALAPTAFTWGRDNRGAMFRVVGRGSATRIENRMGEPSANPYLMIASQIICGLDGLENQLDLQKATDEALNQSVPTEQKTAIERFASSPLIQREIGAEMTEVIRRVRLQEWHRFSDCQDPIAFQLNEYLARL